MAAEIRAESRFSRRTQHARPTSGEPTSCRLAADARRLVLGCAAPILSTGLLRFVRHRLMCRMRFRVSVEIDCHLLCIPAAYHESMMWLHLESRFTSCVPLGTPTTPA